MVDVAIVVVVVSVCVAMGMMLHEPQRDTSGLKECHAAGTVHCAGVTMILD